MRLMKPLFSPTGRVWFALALDFVLIIIGNIIYSVTRPSQVHGSHWTPVFQLIHVEQILLLIYILPLLFRHRRTFNLTFKPVLPKIAYGLLASIISFSFIIIFNYASYGRSFVPEMFYAVTTYPAVTLSLFPFAFIHGGLIEELVYRAVLWGALRTLRIRESRILLIQAVLFTLGHAFNLRYGWYVWFALIFANALVYGFLTLRTKSIIPAIIAHTIANVLGTIAYEIATWHVVASP